MAERDVTLSAEQKAERRFILQRKKLFAAKNKFNLADDGDGYDNGEEGDGGCPPLSERDPLIVVKNLDVGFEFDGGKRRGRYGGGGAGRGAEEDEERDDAVVDGELSADLVALANFGGGSFDRDLREAGFDPAEKPKRFFVRNRFPCKLSAQLEWKKKIFYWVYTNGN